MTKSVCSTRPLTQRPQPPGPADPATPPPTHTHGRAWTPAAHCLDGPLSQNKLSRNRLASPCSSAGGCSVSTAQTKARLARKPTRSQSSATPGGLLPGAHGATGGVSSLTTEPHVPGTPAVSPMLIDHNVSLTLVDAARRSWGKASPGGRAAIAHPCGARPYAHLSAGRREHCSASSVVAPAGPAAQAWLLWQSLLQEAAWRGREELALSRRASPTPNRPARRSPMAGGPQAAGFSRVRAGLLACVLLGAEAWAVSREGATRAQAHPGCECPQGWSPGPCSVPGAASGQCVGPVCTSPRASGAGHAMRRSGAKTPSLEETRDWTWSRAAREPAPAQVGAPPSSPRRAEAGPLPPAFLLYF